MARGLRTRLFGGIGELGVRRPGWVLAVLGLLLVIGVWLGSLLDIKTSRYAMVRADDPEQARLVSFFERYGVPDGLVVAVSGGDRAGRRAMVEALRDAYEADPQFQDRVLARIDGRQTAESLLLYAPDVLTRVVDSFGGDGGLAKVVEGGVPSLLRGVADTFAASLDGDGADTDAAEAEAGLDRLTAMADLLDAQLRGDTSLTISEGLLPEPDADGEAGSLDMMQGVDDAGYLVGRTSDLNVVALFPEFSGSEVVDYLPVVDAAKRIRDGVVASTSRPEITVEITGLPMLTTDEHRLVGLGLMQSGVATGLGVFLMLAFAFRSLRLSAVTLVPLGVGMGISLGIAYLLVGQLNAVTGGMFAVLLGLGIDFSVHLTARYHEELRAHGEGRAVAMGRALLRAGPGILTGAVTTSLAFLTVATARFTAYAELGLLTSVGLFAVLASTLLLLPVLAQARWIPDRAPPVLIGISRLPGLVRVAPRWMFAIFAVGAVAGVMAWPSVRFNSRYLDFMPEREESARALDLLERDGGLTPVIAYLGSESIEDAREKTARLRALDSVGEVVSATDMLPDLSEDDRLDALRAAVAKAGPLFDREKLAGREGRSRGELVAAAGAVVDILDEVIFALAQAGRDTAAAERCKASFARVKATSAALPEDGGPGLARMEGLMAELLWRAWSTARDVAARGHYVPDDLAPMFQRRHGAKDGSAGLAIFVTPAVPVWAPAPAERFAADVRSVDPGASGQAINMHVHTVMVQNDFRRAAAIAAVLVLVVLLIDFRRLSDALLAMVPVILGWGLMLGAMAWLDVALNLANIVVLPLLLGIGIDAGVHVMHRCRQSQVASPDGRARLETLLEGTGSAVVVATLTTMLGFAGLMLPDHRGMQSLGVVMVLGTGACLLTSVLALPALLVWLKKAR